MTIPSIDQNICAQWTEQDRDLYNKLPFYLMEAETKFRKHWVTYKPLLGDISWKANNGDTMRRVMAEPTPVMRQEAIPQLLATDPSVDIINYRERVSDTKLRMHDFASPHFSFLPEFQDFMKHIDRTVKNINRQITIYEDTFYRTMLFHYAPAVYVVGVGLVSAPVGDPDTTGTGGKTNAWIQAQITALAGAGDGYLTLQELFKILSVAEDELGMTPFEGTAKPNGDSNPLNERYALVQSSQSWNNFVDDPWTKENRPLNMNIVTDSFKGDLFGKIRSKLERYPLRYAITNDFVPSMPVPELTEENPNAADYGRTKPNPAYAKIGNAGGTGSPIEVAFLFGETCADAVNPGPPPSDFTKDLDQGAAVKMNWNGKTYLTKEFMIPCVDSDRNRTWKLNEFGRYIRAQSSLALAISMTNMQNCLPIIYKRRTGISTQS